MKHLLYNYRVYLSWGFRSSLPLDTKAIVIPDEMHDPSSWKPVFGNSGLYDMTEEHEKINQFIKDQFDSMLLDPIIIFTIDFLEYHYEQFHQPTIDKIYFLYFVEESIDYIESITEARKRIILEWIQHKKDELKKVSVKKRTSLGDNITEIKPFFHFLNLEYDQYQIILADFLRTKYIGKKGKTIAYMIMALQSANLIHFTIRKELYQSIRNYFGEIGSDEGINKFMRVDRNNLHDPLFKTIRVAIISFINKKNIR